MIILFYTSISSLISPSSGELTILLWSYWADICSKNVGTTCGSDWPSIETLRQSLAIRDWKPQGVV